ncbi:hypothetical protein BV25DRAFT_1824366 [Artomyces pyxidatus]|uniref:Uncharacterized protein n=1 Tax=Artomyces pyxidatus TaxID=48021 RepID=A0ACB8T3J2_9AGAM|nr:hypothetical protein BV25DRAFT_1824366 [Artomyces pyxidatus]
MKFSVILLFALGAQASWLRSDTPAYESWDTQQLTAWLEEYNITIPFDAPSQQQLQDLVESNWNYAQHY